MLWRVPINIFLLVDYPLSMEWLVAVNDRNPWRNELTGRLI